MDTTTLHTPSSRQAPGTSQANAGHCPASGLMLATLVIALAGFASTAFAATPVDACAQAALPAFISG